MNIGEVLIENIPQLWMGMVGILLNSIVVGTLFGKRKYDWFFLVICSVRFIIYNIGFLAIGNAMYGNETWYKITMSTFATVTALGVGIATAVLWQESLAKTLTGILAAEWNSLSGNLIEYFTDIRIHGSIHCIYYFIFYFKTVNEKISFLSVKT